MANDFKVEAGTGRKVFFSSNRAAVGVVSINIASDSLAATISLGNLGKRSELTTETVSIAAGGSITVAANQIEVKAPTNGFVKGTYSFDGAVTAE